MIMREQNRKQYEPARAVGISTWKERSIYPPAILIVPCARFCVNVRSDLF